MKFRLTYEGRVLASGNKNKRPESKHSIRSHFSPQIEYLWKHHPALTELGQRRFSNLSAAQEGINWPHPEITGSTYLELLGDKFEQHGIKWLPLITADMKVKCSTDILLLRPHGLDISVINQGDIDGQLKTLFDSLAIPKSSKGIENGHEQPVYTLLEDDSLIHRVNLETDTILSEPDDANFAKVIITVTLTPIVGNWMTLRFSGH